MKTPDRKVTKAAADYGKGMKGALCGLCRHFDPPNRCAVVIGPIDPMMWCKYFARPTLKEPWTNA